MKKEKDLENQKYPSNIFDFLNVRPFSPGGFFTFLVALALGAPPRHTARACQTYLHQGSTTNMYTAALVPMPL